MTGHLALSGPACLLAAPVILVHGRPGPALGLLFRNAALFVTLGDMFGLAILLVGVFRFVAAGMLETPFS
jgi:hypothetical protein